MNTNHLLTCEACRVIDRSDGVEDGQLWNPDHYATPLRRDLFGLMVDSTPTVFASGVLSTMIA